MLSTVFRIRVAAACVFACITFASPLRADPLTISCCYFDLGPPFGIDFGFNSPGLSVAGEGNGFPAPGLAEFFDALPQTRPVLHTVFSPDMVGDPTSNSSCPGCRYGGDFTFRTGPLAMEPVGDQAIQTPFRMAGTLEGFSPATGAQLFRVSVSGSGTGHVFRDFVGFEFAASPSAVPEPTSVVLLMTGTALLARRSRSGSSQSGRPAGGPSADRAPGLTETRDGESPTPDQPFLQCGEVPRRLPRSLNVQRRIGQ